ncbi:MAG: ATP-binding cassette domain-containing protein [Dehalococcoidia bacterium]
MSAGLQVNPELIGQTEILRSLSREELMAIAPHFEPVQSTGENRLFSQGDTGDYLYVLESGQVRLVAGSDAREDVIAYLEPGDFFGEMALLSGSPRTASAVASGETQLWRLSRENFESILQRHPRVSVEIGRVLAERLARSNSRRVEERTFPVLTLTSERDEMTIGRLPANDLVVPDPQVAGIHARLRRLNGAWTIRDEGSSTGTYVNHQRVNEAVLKDGDEIWIGATRIFLEGLNVTGFVGREGTRIDARDLSRKARSGAPILQGVSLSIQPGEFVAIVGGSGTGKSSLMHALNGFVPAGTGSVHYNGLSLYDNPGLFRSVLGYVPQDDIIHPELTVERTLYYAARLRLPADTSEAELKERIDEVVASVGLSERRQTQVKSLSGGQRKRVSVAVELLSRPAAFFLDEPTSGLDPALEGRMMGLFKGLTQNGATVVVSTHVTQNLGMCDRIAWMARGGRLVFFGSPTEALRHFKVSHFGEVYDLLDDEKASARWAETFVGSAAHRANVAEPLGKSEAAAAPATMTGTAAKRTGGDFWRQLVWLTRRYADVLMRDRQNLFLLLVQAPAIAGALLILFDPDIFTLGIGDGGDARRAMISMHMIGVSAIFLGATNAAREISKESGIYARERLVNIGVVPYVLSKVAVLSVLCVFQAAVLLVLFSLRVDLDLDSSGYIALWAAVLLTALAGLSMGLLTSAVTGNSDRAMAVVPLLVIPQLIFDGALVPIEQMLTPAKLIAQVTISKWFLELAGSLTDLGPRFEAQVPAGVENPYADAFRVAHWLRWVVLSAFTLLFISATLIVQKRKDVS